MATNICMPQLGLTMTQGTVTKWFKQVGDQIRAGDVLVEISTDKITNQMEAPVDGTLLKVAVGEGETAAVKALLAVMGAEGESVVEGGPETTAGHLTPEVAAALACEPPRPAGGWVKASPAARKLAGEHKIDLALVTGTGPGGRIVEKDVRAYGSKPAVKTTPLAEKLAAEHGVNLAGIHTGGRIMAADVMQAVSKAAEGAGVDGLYPKPAGIPLAGMRKIIAERMSLSWNVAPHVTVATAVDMSAAVDLKAKLTQTAGVKMSFTELTVKCAAQALTEYKAINSSLVDGRLVEHQTVNIGVAVALDTGLIVPVIKDADKKGIRALRQEIEDLSDRARKGLLSPDDVTGGTFTVTNLGMYGVTYFTPIINQPESAILGVCQVVDTPVAIGGQLAVKPILNLCLSFDHRLIDGALAAKFLARIRQLLEQPLLLL